MFDEPLKSQLQNFLGDLATRLSGEPTVVLIQTPILATLDRKSAAPCLGLSSCWQDGYRIQLESRQDFPSFYRSFLHETGHVCSGMLRKPTQAQPTKATIANRSFDPRSLFPGGIVPASFDQRAEFVADAMALFFDRLATEQEEAAARRLGIENAKDLPVEFLRLVGLSMITK